MRSRQGGAFELHRYLRRRSELVKTDGIEINNWFVEQLIKDVTTDLAQAKSISYEAAQRLVNNSGYQIYCTMDPDIQKIAEDVYADLSNLNVHSAKGHQLQSGITIMDPIPATSWAWWAPWAPRPRIWWTTMRSRSIRLVLLSSR